MLCKSMLQIDEDNDFQDYKAFTIFKQYENSKGLIHVKHEIFKKTPT